MPALTGIAISTLITWVHSLLALAVTIHVLLYKRDPGASVAWIGLAWLAPVFGSLLYVLLGINRVQYRARVLRRRRPTKQLTDQGPWVGDTYHLDQLECAGQRITQRTARGGNAVTPLHHGEEAYPAMMAAIDGAKCSVALTSYIFLADAAGLPFIEALGRAAARGVDVRVLIDGVGSGYFMSGTFRRLRRAGVPVSRFMHSHWPWRMPFVNLRNHRKLLTVDGRVAYTGGLNIAADNIRSARSPRRESDTHFKVEGPIVSQLVEVFAADWYFTTGQRLGGDAWFPTLESAGDCVARVVTSDPDQELEKIEYLILTAIGCARRSIRIMTPYFLPDERILTALNLAAFRGVAVDITLPQHGDHHVLEWAARVQLPPLLAAGCEVWTQPPPFEHSKLLTVDGVWSLVGSANWDTRSFRLNFELCLEVFDAKLARHLDGLTTSRRGKRITTEQLARRPLPVVLRDSAARLFLPYL
jgi:cardiolipin synthase